MGWDGMRWDGMGRERERRGGEGTKKDGRKEGRKGATDGRIHPLMNDPKILPRILPEIRSSRYRILIQTLKRLYPPRNAVST